MEGQKRGFIAGFLVAMTISALVGGAAALSTQQQATLTYSDIKITVNGESVTPEDVAGHAIEPFTIAGTTYLPVRGIASALDLYVNWDQTTNTIMLSERPIAFIDEAQGIYYYYHVSDLPQEPEALIQMMDDYLGLPLDVGVVAADDAN